MKKLKTSTGVLFSIVLFMLMTQSVLAWSPAENELGPTKDAHVSIDGALSDPSANYGLAETLTVGTGFNGMCVTAIQFDLSTLPENRSTIEDLEFASDITVYGENTRDILVSILLEKDWDETGVTGLENPFHAVELYTSGEANLTTITIGGSTNELIIDLNAYIEEEGVITLIFVPELTEESWITMNSRENKYLRSYSNPPRLQFVELETSGDLTISGFPLIGLFVGFGIAIAIVNFKAKMR